MPETGSLSLALAQINSTVGDLGGNYKRIIRARDEAAAAGADLVVFPELVTVGYPPEDLVLRPSLQEAAHRSVLRLAEVTADRPALLISTPWREGGKLFNAAVLIEGGRVAAVQHKHELPNYGVFDEKRVFQPGPLPEPIVFRGVRFGVLICEDMWFPTVAEHLARHGAEILLVTNSSPFETGKTDVRKSHARARVAETGLPLIYVNQVGGQDELVFDGASYVLDARGATCIDLESWREQILVTQWKRTESGWHCAEQSRPEPMEEVEAVYQAMMLGLRDYVEKNGFPGVILGLSGGIDSALSAVVAVDALGAGRVHCVMLPSKFTSEESVRDARECARRLDIKLDSISIVPLVETIESLLEPHFNGLPRDITEENVQARLRGLILMALSNKFGKMVLTTGNKSEMSVGYATLYGDMCGGYSVLKDIYKMQVFNLARWRNTRVPRDAKGPAGEVIPRNTIVKAPTAELRANQKDEDSLPPYSQLDAILAQLIEKEAPVSNAANGQPEDLVKRVQHLLYTAEYKRRQAPPGVKVTRRSFGRDRRYPVTNRFRD